MKQPSQSSPALPGASDLHAAISSRLRRVVQALPIQPPSFVLAQALNRVLLPRMPSDARQLLSNRSVEILVTDIGLRVRLQLGASGFRVAPAGTPTELRILAPVNSYLRLLRGEDDADRLFFERVLVMEGDTEMGVVLKNTLDAIGPLLRWPGKNG